MKVNKLPFRGGVQACFLSAFSAGKLGFSAGKMRFRRGKCVFRRFWRFFKPLVVGECQNHNYIVVTDLNVANHSFMHNLDNPIETY